ncbi:integrase catalytic domain-containing protein [Nephila pilipes]|uniref:Integrase catalytic domain-containing protein n=1 Tax=Nephila pilipes TaxID=299642 RepID=A0A8X6UVX5_NEPPI|nr:integrase catalytic domain-containing protein [Nephila pilipes]
MDSQRSYITKFIAGKMNLKGLGEGNCKSWFIDGIERVEKHQRYNINLSNVDGSYNCELEVLDEKKICASLPRMNDDNCLKQLKDLGQIVKYVTDPIAQSTIFGWVVSGKMKLTKLTYIELLCPVKTALIKP